MDQLSYLLVLISVFPCVRRTRKRSDSPVGCHGPGECRITSAAVSSSGDGARGSSSSSCGTNSLTNHITISRPQLSNNRICLELQASQTSRLTAEAYTPPNERVRRSGPVKQKYGASEELEGLAKKPGVRQWGKESYYPGTKRGE